MVDTVMTAVTTVDVKSSKTVKPKVVPIRGRPKSGRVWKEVRKPTHTLIKKKVSDKVWKEKMQLKRDALATQKREQGLRSDRNEEKSKERTRIEEKRKLAEENEQKQGLSNGQIVTDPKKIKKLEAQEIRKRRKVARQKKRRDQTK